MQINSILTETAFAENFTHKIALLLCKIRTPIHQQKLLVLRTGTFESSQTNAIWTEICARLWLIHGHNLEQYREHTRATQSGQPRSRPKIKPQNSTHYEIKFCKHRDQSYEARTKIPVRPDWHCKNMGQWQTRRFKSQQNQSQEW